MTNKDIYKDKLSGKICAIETDSEGNFLSASNPVLTDSGEEYNFHDASCRTKKFDIDIKGLEPLSKTEYLKLLHKDDSTESQ